MFASYYKIAIRNFKQQPVYTFINIFGLATGVICCLLIAFYVWDELQYDIHNPNADRIYRVTQSTQFEGEQDGSNASVPFQLRDAAVLEFPGLVEDGVRFFNLEAPNVSIGNEEDEYIRQENFFFTDPSVFKIFDVTLSGGNPETALSAPNTVIITEKIARQYFKDENPVGKELVFDGRISLEVTGVMDEWDKQSHFRPEILASFETLRNLWSNYEPLTERWLWNPVWTYLILEEGVQPEQVAEQLEDFSEKYFRPYIGEKEKIVLNLQPLTDIRLRTGIENEIEPTGSRLAVYIFSAVALLILLIACINFINLSTARSLRRSKEVGLRLTLGAYRRQLVQQFMSEAFLYSALAVATGVIITLAVFPWFNAFTGKELSFARFGVGGTTVILLGIVVVLALFSGFYPSAVLSSLNPVDSLRSAWSKGKKGNRTRKALVIFQFVITSLLLIGTALAYFQYKHLQDKNLGFDKEQIVVIPASMSIVSWYYDVYKERLLNHSGIKSVTGSKTVMGSPDFIKYQMTPEGYGLEDEQFFSKLFVTVDFTETMGIELLAGRPFSDEYSTDPEQALLINKSMVEHLDWDSPGDAIGKTFRISDRTAVVVGVTEDFHYSYLHRKMDPLVMELPETEQQHVANIDFIKARLDTGNPEGAIEHMQDVWERMDKSHPFEYYFLDDKLNEIYQAEQKFSFLLSIFAAIAVIIGCLGLLGLASYSIETRRKEIGVRKVLGAATSEIFFLLSRDYLKMVITAHIIALPVISILAYYWLGDLPYRIDMGWYIGITFLTSLVVSTIICMMTVSSHVIKASVLNPVESLQRE